jgi:hypothetical protein
MSPLDLETDRHILEIAAKLGSAGDGDRTPPLRVPDLPSVADVCADPVSYLIADLLPEAAVCMLSGESGCGKSTIALSMAGAVATGGTFAGRLALQRPALILDRENPAAVIVERLDRLRISDGSALKIWGGWLREEAPAAGSAPILEWVAVTDPRPFIVVDSLIAFHPGAENDSTETRRFLHQFRMLANAGCTVLLLHHSGKADTAQDYRGSSDMKAGIDVAFHLANIGADPARLETVRLRAFKSRVQVAGELILTFEDGAFVQAEKGGVPARTNGELLADLLREKPGLGAREFEEAAKGRGLGRDRARRFLHDGAKAGTIRPEKGERNAVFYYWNGAGTEAGHGLF